LAPDRSVRPDNPILGEAIHFLAERLIESLGYLRLPFVSWPSFKPRFFSWDGGTPDRPYGKAE
jgi:hypothetical protein